MHMGINEGLEKTKELGWPMSSFGRPILGVRCIGLPTLCLGPLGCPSWVQAIGPTWVLNCGSFSCFQIFTSYWWKIEFLHQSSLLYVSVACWSLLQSRSKICHYCDPVLKFGVRLRMWHPLSLSWPRSCPPLTELLSLASLRFIKVSKISNSWLRR